MKMQWRSAYGQGIKKYASDEFGGRASRKRALSAPRVGHWIWHLWSCFFFLYCQSTEEAHRETLLPCPGSQPPYVHDDDVLQQIFASCQTACLDGGGRAL